MVYRTPNLLQCTAIKWTESSLNLIGFTVIGIHNYLAGLYLAGLYLTGFCMISVYLIDVNLTYINL